MRKRLAFCLSITLAVVLGVGPLLTLAAPVDGLVRSSSKPAASARDFGAKNEASKPAKLAFTSNLLSRRPAQNQSSQDTLPGQTTTILPDGRLLKLGGLEPAGPAGDGVIGDSHVQLQHSRAWHTATMLPDGRVLIVGGIGANGQVVEQPEIFNSETQSSELLTPPPSRSALHNSLSSITPRVYHTATLLTEGLVLIAGGVSADGKPLKTAELWDFRSGGVIALESKLHAARYNHTAALLRDGNVLLSGGADKKGVAQSNGELFNVLSRRFVTKNTEQTSVLEETSLETGNARLAESLPVDGATAVPVDAFVALRLSTHMRVETLNTHSMTLSNSYGPIEVRVVPAEAGRLAFVTFLSPLLPGLIHTLSISGAKDAAGVELPLTTLTFSTASAGPSAESLNREQWLPDANYLQSDSNRSQSDSSWQKISPLQAPAGVTALAGQILKLDGEPLPNVTIQVDEAATRSDASGRFLLSPLKAGRQVMIIHGHTANKPGKTYGMFEVGVDLKADSTNALPYTIWMPVIDNQHAARLSVPTSKRVTVTSPLIPDLEVNIPRNARLRNADGDMTTFSITPIPPDRPPFPGPKGGKVFFVLQTHGARVESMSGVLTEGPEVVFPNVVNGAPGSRVDLYSYSAKTGWRVYGQGVVTANAKRIKPDPGVTPQTLGCVWGVGNVTDAPAEGPSPGGGGGATDGDPVDLSTGLFLLNQTDIILPDVMPITLARTYRPRDTVSRPFGIGATHSYQIYLVGNGAPYDGTQLVLPDGGRIRYDRISPGTGQVDAVLEHTATQSQFYKSRLTWNQDYGWDLSFKDGSRWKFQAYANAAPMLIAMSDRNGNTISITRTSQKQVSKVMSPNGRWIEFTYDSNDRITQARDNIARTVGYTYDTSGRLWKVTDPIGGVTEYTYDSSARMLTIKDARGIIYLTNQYNTNGRVSTQTQPDGGVYQFAYTISSGKVTQTDVTTPRGNVRRVAFNSDGYATSETFAPGTSNEQTYTYELQSGTNFMLSVTDALGRKTSASYDSYGDPTSITRLTGTSNALTTSFTYESTFNQLASVTDPLSHTTNFVYDSKGNLGSVTDPLSNQGTYTYNSAGQPDSYTNAEGKTTQFTYDGGDLVRMTNPPGQSITRFLDSAGRVLSISNALGHTVRYQWDALNRPLSATDPLQGATSFTYDANNNLLSVTDPRSKVISYTYDSQDRATARTDAMGHADSYQYDVDGNLHQVTDRKSQVTGYTYDSLNRLTLVTYADSSTIGYTYDAGNRVTQIVDSVGGTISYAYDDLNRLTSETTTKGTVSYSYDNASRLTSLTVPGQSSVSYTYDNANRLTQITQGSSTVSFAYDHAGRTTSQTLANGVVTEYSYDDASHLTAITYKKSGTTLGNLIYQYDAAGRRIQIGGSYARTGLPSALTTASYNDGNRQTAFGSQTLSYDLNGNLTSDGANSYTWNARDQLVSISASGLSASFQYDAVGRRSSKTVNSVTTGFLYNGANIVQEQSGGSATANILGGGLDEFFGRTESSGTTTPLVDALGSPIALADSSGVVQTQYIYDPFGGTSTTGTTSSNPSQYTGRENDGTGLYYYRARYYSPSLQRFISEDPIGVLGGVNVYAYASNNPISFVDPSGLDSFGDFVGGVIKAIHPFAHIPGDRSPWAPIAGTPFDFDIPWKVNPHSCAFKAGFYTGIGLMIAAAVAEPMLAPELEAEFAAAEGEAEAEAAAGGSPTWPSKPGDMDKFMGFEGERVPDGSYTGRNKVVWRPSDNVKVTYEEHPYHTNAPDYHRGPHWHYDAPGVKHRRYLPGDPIP
jgi:RHS repeat-associated protein